MFSVKWGEMVVNRGEYINLVDLRVHTPPIVVKRGDPLAPSIAAAPLGPITYSKKPNGVRARHGLRASCHRFGIAFEAGWGTWERLPCARFAYTPKWLKKRGIPPFDLF